MRKLDVYLEGPLDMAIFCALLEKGVLPVGGVEVRVITPEAARIFYYDKECKPQAPTGGGALLSLLQQSGKKGRRIIILDEDQRANVSFQDPRLIFVGLPNDGDLKSLGITKHAMDDYLLKLLILRGVDAAVLARDLCKAKGLTSKDLLAQAFRRSSHLDLAKFYKAQIEEAEGSQVKEAFKDFVGKWKAALKHMGLP